MTHSVAATSNAALAPESVTARPARTTGASFAAAHAAAVNASTATGATSASGSSSSSSSASDAPKGERTQRVTGHSYVEIISGPRNGMFINNTGAKRDGEAFLIVRRHGREFHIYGTGADRAVYEVGRKRQDTAASGSTGASGTTATGTAGTTGASTTGTAGAQTAPATTV
jgi:hypothetical protein